MNPDYGLDAPGVIRNLALVAIVLAPVAVLTPLWLAIPAGVTSAACALEAVYMVWSSRSGKLRQRDRLLASIDWTSARRVLDVGCGRGLLTIGAARRLRPDGLAIGIDLWQAADLTGNRPAAALENARAERALDRVRIVTADMRRLPLGDGTIDAAVSSLAVHNVPDAAGRAAALQEIARVVRPGGLVLLQDFRNTASYADELRRLGFADIAVSGLQFRIFPPAHIVQARKPR
jgi:ubiquinone/menaquinone biosynthesis C-methylase UbiE